MRWAAVKDGSSMELVGVMTCLYLVTDPAVRRCQDVGQAEASAGLGLPKFSETRQEGQVVDRVGLPLARQLVGVVLPARVDWITVAFSTSREVSWV
jgi:hypothetical protein